MSNHDSECPEVWWKAVTKDRLSVDAEVLEVHPCLHHLSVGGLAPLKEPTLKKYTEEKNKVKGEKEC